MNHSPKNCDVALLQVALADRAHLRLLNLMEGREECVCSFVEIHGDRALTGEYAGDPSNMK